MPQVIVGLFTSYRDGHEALRALQLLGLSRDSGHLYRPGPRDAAAGILLDTDTWSEVELHAPDTAEYAAHGEHQGVIGACNRYSGCESDLHGRGNTALARNDDVARTLLVISEPSAIKPIVVCDVLYEHGAVAVKDPAGHWRFSPYRRICRSQE